MPAAMTTPPGTLMEQFKSLFKAEFDTDEFRKKHKKVLLIYARLKYQLKTRFHNPEKKSSADSAPHENSETASQA